MLTCRDCIHCIMRISENGYHAKCCLSSKKAMECITGRKSHFKNAFSDDYAEDEWGDDE